jgi:hypothetical protein
MEVQWKEQIQGSWESRNWVFTAMIMDKFGIPKQTVPDIMYYIAVF